MCHEIAWLMLRIVFGGLFLWPIKSFLTNFNMAAKIAGYLIPVAQKFFAAVMIAVMFLGGLSIIVGFYAQIAGLVLMFYCLFGVVVHQRLAKRINELYTDMKSSPVEIQEIHEACTLGIIGHETSAQKNIVLAAVGLFIFLMGSGPLSFTGNLF